MADNFHVDGVNTLEVGVGGKEGVGIGYAEKHS